MATEEQMRRAKFSIDITQSIQSSVNKGQWTEWDKGANVDMFLRSVMNGIRQSGQITEQIVELFDNEKDTFATYMGLFEELQQQKTITDKVVKLLTAEPEVKSEKTATAKDGTTSTETVTTGGGFGNQYAAAKFVKIYDQTLHGKLLDLLSKHPLYQSIEVATTNLRQRAGLPMRATSGPRGGGGPLAEGRGDVGVRGRGAALSLSPALSRGGAIGGQVVWCRRRAMGEPGGAA